MEKSQALKKFKRCLLILCVVMGVSIDLWAAPSRFLGGTSEWSGQGSVKGSRIWENPGRDLTQDSVALRLEPQWAWKGRERGNRQLRFKIKPLLQSDPLNRSDVEQWIYDPQEVYVEGRFLPWVTQVGFNTFTWGVSDVFNPLDVVNPRYFYDPLNSDKRGSPSVLLKYDNSTWIAEVLYIPVQMESRLPGPQSAWLPRRIFRSTSAEGATFLMPETLQYSYVESQSIGAALRHNWGTRLQYQGEGWDASAMVFEGAANTPAVQPLVSGVSVSIRPPVIQANPAFQLRPLYYRSRTAGVTFVKPWNTWIFRFVGSHSQPLADHPLLPGWSMGGLVSIENSVPIGVQTLTVLAQSTYYRHQEQGDNTLSSMDRLFDQSFLLGFRATLPWELTVFAAGLYDAREKGSFYQARIEKKITDGWLLDITADILQGQDGTVLGTYRNNDRCTMKLTALW